MQPHEIVNQIHDRTNIPKEHISGTLTELKALIVKAMQEGVVVDLGRDFGRFKTKRVKGRDYIVPSRPDRPVKSGGSTKVKFYPSASIMKNIS